VNRFFGVRFGQTTAGANRFKAPQTPASWSTPQQAISKTSCAQWTGNLPAWSGTPGWVGSEDCLFLHIITPNAGVPGLPANAAANTFPVQFYIYGGGFAAEAPATYQFLDNFYASGSDNLAHLPHSGKTVTVLVNYRVNYLGGLSHAALRGGIAGNTASGNWHIHDCIAGLTWVQSNIGNFGGDPSKVTIQGESAGATTSMALVTSPLVYPPNVPAALFRGAIAQSVWPMMDNGVIFSQKVRDVAGNAMVWSTQCSTAYDSSSSASATDLAAIASCLRTDSVEFAQGVQGGFSSASDGGYVSDADYAAFETANGGTGVMSYINYQTYGYSPCVDGYIWTKAPKDHVIDGVGVTTHLMVGNNANEEALFAPSYVGVNTESYIFNMGYFYASYGTQLSYTSTAAEYITLGNSMPQNVVQNQPYYTAIVDDWQRQTNQLDDGYFTANIGLIFDTFSAQSGRAPNSLFRYLYAEPNPADGAPALGAPHTAELNYVWGCHTMQKSYIFDNLVQGSGPKTTYSPNQIALGNSIQKYWANFIHTGSATVASMNVPTWSSITRPRSTRWSSSPPSITAPSSTLASCLSRACPSRRRTSAGRSRPSSTPHTPRRRRRRRATAQSRSASRVWLPSSMPTTAPLLRVCHQPRQRLHPLRHQCLLPRRRWWRIPRPRLG
jgi:carboxylesterase type B